MKIAAGAEQIIFIASVVGFCRMRVMNIRR